MLFRRCNFFINLPGFGYNTKPIPHKNPNSYFLKLAIF